MFTSPVAFHGQGTGIGYFVGECANSGITTTAKAIDNAGWAAEACKIAIESGVPLNVIMRWTKPGGIDDGAGDFYQKAPRDSAIEYWDRVKVMWDKAPELHQYKGMLWLEIGNELRTQYDDDAPNYENMHPVDWLGWWGFYLADVATQEGFNVILFGMNHGTPEPEDWLLPGMRAFLELSDASVYPKIGVSVHEGMGRMDWRLNRPADNVPYVNGRYRDIVDTCDIIGLDPPPIFVSEWAWSYDHMPPQDRALEDVEWMANFYGKDINVEGVCLWNLDRLSSVGTIAAQMEAFLPAMTEFTLNWEGEATEPPVGETFEEHLWRTSLENQVLKLNAFAALQGAIRADGYGIVSSEYWTGYDGVIWAAQATEHYGPDHPRRVYYALVGDWANVQWIEDPASGSPSLPPGRPPLSGLALGPLFRVPHVITSSFNVPRSYGPHEGIDVDIFTAVLDSIESVLCAYDGVIIHTGYGDAGYANHVIVEHAYELEGYEPVIFRTWYAHLDNIYVSAGQEVRRGWAIGEIGATGNADGEHVHFNLQVPGYGLDGYFIPDAVDPAPYLVLDSTPPPPVGVGAQVGLHASADGAGRWHVDDFAQYTTAKVEAVKVLSAHTPEDIALLKSQNPGIKTWVVRAFLEFGGRAVTPQQFFDWTYSDVKRTLDVIGDSGDVWVELHNEPNLVSEGYGVAWDGGIDFSIWLGEVLALYRIAMPDTKFLYPGLSPGGDGGPTARNFFWQVRGVDGYGVHAYWGIIDTITDALNEVAYFTHVGKPLIVTEASNKGVYSDDVKGTDYIKFAKEVAAIAVTYFLCSARHDPGKYADEVWVGTRISNIVGNR